MGNADSKAQSGVSQESTTAGDMMTSLANKASQLAEFASMDVKDEVNNSSRRTLGQRHRDHTTSDAHKGRQSDVRDDAEEKKESTISTKITDEMVHVNLAMADLMAYLQVVANNSNQLPLTKRDDPELDRTVSTLSSEEYARKSAAFVPANVRVLGGTFTRYGRVWDLPTSEEYNASDGALEPGRSYGGACCNSMLKVVYDAANTTSGSYQADTTSEALFRDDEDDEIGDGESLNNIKSLKSGCSLDAINQGTNGPSLCSASWADMLRQMKAEFKEIGYAQVPKITTSRKMDLTKPFSLVPDDFDPSVGKKRSLLIACNYRSNREAELKASHDDIRSVKDYIVNVHDFPESSDLMTVLIDDGDNKPPTFINIIEAFKALSEESQPGDAVFVQFSGHGGRVLDSAVESEAQTYDEVIVPSDYEISGLIRDTLIFKTLLAPMRYGVTVTLLFDTCDTGMVLELPYSWSAKSEKKDTVPKLTMNEDFSFVRFLKVVKTLYETSTFTQLGKTVGSALGIPVSPSASNRVFRPEPEVKKTEMINMIDREQLIDEAIKANNSILDALVEACSPGRRTRDKSKETGSAVDSEHIDKGRAIEPVTNTPESLFEQVINCTLMSDHQADDEYSDDETFKTRTYDDPSFEDTDGGTDLGDSFESYTNTDDEECDRTRPRARSKRR